MHGLETSYTIRTFNSLRFGVFFWIFERTVDFFYELFCEGPSALRKYALTAVRGLSDACDVEAVYLWPYIILKKGLLVIVMNYNYKNLMNVNSLHISV